MKILVYHASYGCETGCCGHVITDDVNPSDEYFALGDHPNKGESDLEFAKRMVQEWYGEDHVKDLDWDECIVSED